MSDDSIGRRDFLKGAAAGLVVLLAEDELIARGAMQEAPPVAGPPVKIGLIGLGHWGKEILATLSRLPSAQVAILCDNYEPAVRKSLEIAPKAATVADYRRVLESAEVEAVVVATPSHRHKEIVLAALQAGKHVYCEAPLAHSLEEAKAVALAGQQATKLKFQAGLQGRANALYRHVAQFVKAGVLGRPAQVVAQWNKKQSWRRAAPTPERERELNWRLFPQTSAGLLGEAGIHQLDLANWYLNELPTAVTGFGAVAQWDDGREVADTVQCLLEYPKKIRTVFMATLASSFSDAFTLFQGSDGSLMLREKRGWLVKEADSPLLGWEVYARKESIHNETGICMVADASKILAAGQEPGKEGSVEPTQEALYLALEGFTRSLREGTKPACGPVEGYQATVVAIKANEAVQAGSKIGFQKNWFELT